MGTCVSPGVPTTTALQTPSQRDFKRPSDGNTMSRLACQRQLHVDNSSFQESILVRHPNSGEEAAGLTGLSPAVSPGPSCHHAPMAPAAMSLPLMAPTSLCQCQRPAKEQLTAGESSGMLSSAASCDGWFGTRQCPYTCRHPCDALHRGLCSGRAEN